MKVENKIIVLIFDNDKVLLKLDEGIYKALSGVPKDDEYGYEPTVRILNELIGCSPPENCIGVKLDFTFSENVKPLEPNYRVDVIRGANLEDFDGYEWIDITNLPMNIESNLKWLIPFVLDEELGYIQINNSFGPRWFIKNPKEC